VTVLELPEKERSIHAEVIADSTNVMGHRLTTFVVTYPRMIHSEIMTHRALTKSSASSRAIPVAKMKAKIERYPAFPTHWGAEQKGMQSGADLVGRDLERARRLFEDVHEGTLGCVEEYLADLALDFPDPEERKTHTLHKSLLNRLTEPFMWITVIISGTEWENFYRQRVSPLAEPHFNELATKMQTAHRESVPQKLMDGEWHLPFVTDEERARYPVGKLKAYATARCARVSYLNLDGTYSEDADIALFNRLCNPGDGPPHAAPLEHIATPNTKNQHIVDWYMEDGTYRTATLPKLGNFLGWDQLRHLVLGF
jgi:hypothetical protein